MSLLLIVFVVVCKTRGRFHFCQGFLTVYSEALEGWSFVFTIYLFISPDRSQSTFVLFTLLVVDACDVM